MYIYGNLGVVVKAEPLIEIYWISKNDPLLIKNTTIGNVLHKPAAIGTAFNIHLELGHRNIDSKASDVRRDYDGIIKYVISLQKGNK